MTMIDLLLQKAKDLHGDVCPGIVMGTRMAMAGMRELGMDPMKKNRNLIVYVEIDRCATDAIQAVTGCTLGHRSLKSMNYGKFAATFVDTSQDKAVRIAAYPKKPDQPEDTKEVVKMVYNAPEEDLFAIQHVRVQIPREDMPGFPTRKNLCSSCGEQVMDGREIIFEGKPVCRNCKEGSYYTLIS